LSKTLSTLGLRHLALFTIHFDAMVHFYRDVVGMKVVWQPDADNIYLSSGTDNLALHRKDNSPTQAGRLDHLGFAIETKEEVDRWHQHLKDAGVEIKAAPRDHRDGTRSFYCLDPDANLVQFIYLVG